MDTDDAGTDAELDDRLDALLEELGRVAADNEALKEVQKRQQTTIQVLAGALLSIFVLFVSVGVLGAVFITANRSRIGDVEQLQKQRDKDQRNEQSRVTAALVGNCAVGNAILGVQHDVIASTKVDRPFVTTPSFEAWLDEQLGKLDPIDCKAIVPPELGTANLCLQYAPRLDPDTGQPIPTTTTPENGAACRKVAGS